MYSIVFSEDAKKDLKSLQKKAPQALKNSQSCWMNLKNIPEQGLDKDHPGA